MYNNNANNVNPLQTLLGLTGGGQGGGAPQPAPAPAPASQPTPQQGGGGDPMEILTQLLSAMTSGQNAMNALTSIIPTLGRQVQNHTPQELENFTRNEYKRQGVDINAAMKQLEGLMNTMGYNAYNAGGQNAGGYNANNGGYNANNGGYNTNNTNNMNTNY